MKDERSALAKVTGLLSGVAGRVIVIALLLLLTFEGLRFCFDFGHDIFYQQPVEAEPGTDHTVTLEDGMSMSAVADQLEEEGLIRNKTAFVIQGELYQTNLYPGEYTLNTSMTTKEILAALNTEPEEHERQEESADAKENTGDIIGGGGDMVDEEQAAAAAGEGIVVTPDSELSASQAQTEANGAEAAQTQAAGAAAETGAGAETEAEGGADAAASGN